jgi:hypothetical protein
MVPATVFLAIALLLWAIPPANRWHEEREHQWRADTAAHLLRTYGPS